MTIHPDDSSPIFRQIGDHVRKAVAAGIYLPGEAIPSLRAMALELHVNPNTVKRAYEELERSGLIEARPGVGMFVTRQGARRAGREAEEMVTVRFQEGLQIAAESGMDPERTRDLFDGLWVESGGQIRRTG